MDYRWTKLVFSLAALLSASQLFASEWYRGAIHAHTSWSDGQELPELVAQWYKTNGYNFLSTADHNVVMQGTKWKTIGSPEVPTVSVPMAESLFGPGWVVQSNGQVKLKTFAEIKAKLDVPGQFLTIQNEEIDTNTTIGGKTVHMNALNLGQYVAPQPRSTVLETINTNMATVAAQAQQLDRPILFQVNHPLYSNYDITPQDLAAAGGGTLAHFELCNPHADRARWFGDATHPGGEKLWDIANTIRIRNNQAPLYGTAADDSHHYGELSPDKANPGRAWIMVRADNLGENDIVEAMNAGDYYCSTGVTLSDMAFDPFTGTFSVQVAPEAGVNYTIEFIGTPVGADPAVLPDGSYSADIGKVLQSIVGTSASYTLTGDELYVRAVVRSDKQMSNPTTGGLLWETAWCQPVGAWMVIPEPTALILLASGLIVLFVFVGCKSISAFTIGRPRATKQHEA